MEALRIPSLRCESFVSSLYICQTVSAKQSASLCARQNSLSANLKAASFQNVSRLLSAGNANISSATSSLNRRLLNLFAAPRRMDAGPDSGPRAALPEAAPSAAPVDQQQLEVTEKDLLVVGPGVLGSLVAEQWLEADGNSKVVGQTRTPDHHEQLRARGIVPVVRQPEAEGLPKFANVIFCAPPSGNADYPAEVRAAAARWSGEGTLLFTSSSGVYSVSGNELCTEVHTLDRGAHTFWLRMGKVESRPDYMLNLIHYEDAASLCVAILRARKRGQVFMGCDNHPVSREGVMDATVRSGKFEGSFDGFTSEEGPLGKLMNNDKTREALKWQPKYSSFASFLGVDA
eukprot:jgi/Mesen1/8082/ME000434S07325